MTLVISSTGIAAAFPIGIVLALGRRSPMPIVRWLSVAFIEFVRGVPLITALAALYDGSSHRYLNLYGPPGTIRTIPYHALMGKDGFGELAQLEGVVSGLVVCLEPREGRTGLAATCGWWLMAGAHNPTT